jgi:hypothetical protein
VAVPEVCIVAVQYVEPVPRTGFAKVLRRTSTVPEVARKAGLVMRFFTGDSPCGTTD